MYINKPIKKTIKSVQGQNCRSFKQANIRKKNTHDELISDNYHGWSKIYDCCNIGQLSVMLFIRRITRRLYHQKFFGFSKWTFFLFFFFPNNCLSSMEHLSASLASHALASITQLSHWWEYLNIELALDFCV